MKKKGSFLGLVPLLIFLLIYATTGIFTDKIDNMPLLVAFTITAAIALCLNSPNKEKINFEQRVEIFCKGASDSTLLLLLIIFLLAGAFYSVADAMGAVKSVVNLGLTLLPLKMLLPGLFIIGCILSFAMGTSMGTVSALTPIAIGIANETGISLPLICGVVVGGAMFGDNLSFISDTTIAATRTQEVEMKDKFKVNFLIVLPAVILNIIVLSFIGGEGVQGAIYEYSLLNLVPYVSIIVLALIGINVIIVLTIGVVLGLIIGLINNSFTFIEIFSVVQRGMGWMENMAIIALVVGGVVAIMEYLGGIDYLLENLTAKIKSKKGAEFGISILVSLLCLATTNNTVSIITAGPLAKDIADKFSVDRRRVAGLMPYAGQILVAAAMAQISPVSIVPYSWYSMFMIVMGILAIITGIPKLKEKN